SSPSLPRASALLHVVTTTGETRAPAPAAPAPAQGAARAARALAARALAARARAGKARPTRAASRTPPEGTSAVPWHCTARPRRTGYHPTRSSLMNHMVLGRPVVALLFAVVAFPLVACSKKSPVPVREEPVTAAPSPEKTPVPGTTSLVVAYGSEKKS